MPGIRTLSDQITLFKNERKFTIEEREEGDGEPSHEELGEIMMNTGMFCNLVCPVTSYVGSK